MAWVKAQTTKATAPKNMAARNKSETSAALLPQLLIDNPELLIEHGRNEAAAATNMPAIG
jgi:hypothetical protein